MTLGWLRQARCVVRTPTRAVGPAGGAELDARASATLLSLLQHELAETRERKAVSLTVVQNMKFSLRAEQGGRRGSSDALCIDLDAA